MAGKKIFISYRREDAGSDARSIYQFLSRRFGEKQLFFDTSTIRTGQKFEKIILENIRQSTIMLIVIGPRWSNVTNPSGTRRLEEEEDFVRREILDALNREISIVPVLVNGARLPKPEDLPLELRAITTFHYTSITPDQFDRDVKHLADTIAPQVRSDIAWLPIALGALLIGIAGIVGLLLATNNMPFGSRSKSPSSAPPVVSSEQRPAGPSSDRSSESSPSPQPASNNQMAVPPPATESGHACSLDARHLSTDEAGRAVFSLSSSCGPLREISLQYRGWTFYPTIPSNDGKADVTFDLFAGPEAVTFSMPSAAPVSVNAPMQGTGNVVKLALIWKGPVDLNLHGLQFNAEPGENDDVFVGQPRSFGEAINGMTGFISAADDGKHEGDHVEVYTFIKTLSGRHGRVVPYIDYVSRGSVPSGEYCGDGRYARVDFEFLLFENGEAQQPISHHLDEKPCGEPLDGSMRLRKIAPPVSF